MNRETTSSWIQLDLKLDPFSYENQHIFFITWATLVQFMYLVTKGLLTNTIIFIINKKFAVHLQNIGASGIYESS